MQPAKPVVDMDHWVIQGVADFIGTFVHIGRPLVEGLAVMLLTLLIIMAYYLAFRLLFELAWALKEAYHKSSGLAAFLIWWPAVAVYLVLMTIHIIHTILFIWVGYSAFKDFRDWWHRPA